LLSIPSVSSKLERHFSGVAAQQSGNKINKDPGRASVQAWAFTMLRRGESALADGTWATMTQRKIVDMVDTVEKVARGNTDLATMQETVDELDDFTKVISATAGIYKSAPPDDDEDQDQDETTSRGSNDVHVGQRVDGEEDEDAASAAVQSSDDDAATAAPMDLEQVPKRSKSRRIMARTARSGD